VSNLFQLSLHYLLTIVFKDYGHLPSFTKLADRLGLSKYYSNGTENEHYNNHSLVASDTLIANANFTVNDSDRANATFVFLCRNSDLPGVVASIQQMEDRFNRKHGYPWVLLNEAPFTEEFKEYVLFSRLFSHIVRTLVSQEGKSAYRRPDSFWPNTCGALVSTWLDRRRAGHRKPVANDGPGHHIRR